MFVPRQIKDEISRNREAKIADALDKYKKDAAGFRVNFPAFTKAHQEFGEIRDLLKQANKKHAELLAKVTGQIDELELDADVLIRDLFKAATEVPVSNQCYLKAIERFRKGNPPGKNKNTIGDEINWEVLKEAVPSEQDLYFVSKDRDYKSAIGEGAFNRHLSEEWLEEKKSNIIFYDSLTDFFKKNFPDIKLAADIKNKALIERLAASSSFASTHAVVGVLLEQPSFTTKQAEEMIDIAHLNQQVGWIITDPDVAQLYTRIANENGGNVSEDTRKILHDFIAEIRGLQEEKQEDDEEIPF